ncbi:PPPDE putative peptidase domain-containing protein [Gloeopeniophorella convolvens]|nr:PPPDE putative peptidase domain-containing protein [Gloeopeniophorella convolvens]
MTAPVKLYVYDLSRGIARSLSMQLTGRQIDGVWHSSVVVFNREIFYGQGIVITAPGQSHLGQPLQIIDMGQTAIDEQTFEDYVSDIREHYTADKYHLLDFNCNSFTNDCIGFLTGGSIPAFIKDLPSDFLSTPFGIALRPHIDAMYRRPTGAVPVPAAPQPSADLSTTLSSVLSQVAARASGAQPTAQIPGSGYSTPSTGTVAAPLHLSTNPASFRSLLGTHRAVVAMFTSQTCAPCKMIEPVFDELAHAKTRGAAQGRVAFAKVDIGAGMGGMVAREYQVMATPTFAFFLDGKRVHELKGPNAPELRTQVDLLLFNAFPPHVHTGLALPAVNSLPLLPILTRQVVDLDTVRDSLAMWIDGAPALNNTVKPAIKEKLSQVIFPWLRQRYIDGSTAAPSTEYVDEFSQTVATLVAVLPHSSLFPLLDVWRLAILEPAIAEKTLTPLISVLDSTNATVTSSTRGTLLTLLRLAANALGTSLARPLLVGDARAKTALRGVLVQTLLVPDRLVRLAAASLAFNFSVWVQKGRIARARGDAAADTDGIRENEEDGEWEVELVSAVAEALAKEEESEAAVHRLTATLAFLIRLSPSYRDQLAPLLDVLQVRRTLKGKLAEGGKPRIQNKGIRALIEEVADTLCREP